MIEVRYEGDQTYETVAFITRSVLKATEQLRQKNMPVMILNSLAGVGKTSAGSRKAASEALLLDVYDKVAIYGANLFFRNLAKLIIIATGKSKSVKYFNTRKDAEQWLLKK